MNIWIESMNSCSDVWLDVVSSVVVQSVVVFAVVWIAARLLRNCSAALRFWIWQAAALKLLLIPFSLVVVLPLWPAPEKPATTPAYLATAADVYQVEPVFTHVPPETMASVVEVQSPTLTALAYVFSGWLLIVSIQIARCLFRKRQLAAFLKTCGTASKEQQLRLRCLAKKLGLSKPVAIVRGDVQVPLVTGVFSPTIILPSQQEFEASSFDQVVLHELAHVKRNDLSWVWLPEVLRMLFFFHPLAYWIQRRAKLESEMACDELVLSVGSNRRSYAKTLLELASPAAGLSTDVGWALLPVAGWTGRSAHPNG